MVEVMSAPCAVRSTCLIVSTAGMPTMAAPNSATASMVRSMVATSMSGRTASCTSTMSSGSAGRAAKAGRREDHKYVHNSWSIHRKAVYAADCARQVVRRSATLRAYHFGMHRVVPPKRAPMLPIETSMLKPGLRLAVGLSGGADSVALVRALAARAAELGPAPHAP